MPLPTRIILIGFMGAGKSTVGPLLAGRLGWPFVDLDSAVIASAGKPVAQIFADHGEAQFRQLESHHLAALLADNAPRVLALGGGAIELEGNRELLAATVGTAVVYLEAPLDVLLTRCTAQQHQPDAAARPLLSESEPLFARRVELYQKTGIAVPTESLPVEDVVEHILRLLQMEA